MSLYRALPRALPRNPLRSTFHRSPTPLHPLLRRQFSSRPDPSASFFTRLRHALNDTKTEWYFIPAGVGIAVVGFTQIRKRHASSTSSSSVDDRPVKPMGSFQVSVLSTLPLKALSYWWGRFNEIPLPRPLRAPGFKLYAWIFGVNLNEVEKPLDEYRNLAEFFYRRLKPGARPIDARPGAVVSPADGKVLQFGEVRTDGEVGDIKGMTYSLDALLGTQDSAPPSPASPLTQPEGQTAARYGKGGDSDSNAAVYNSTDTEFANVNGISYTLPSLLSGTSQSTTTPKTDASLPASTASTATVSTDLASTGLTSWFATPQKRLFYLVVYLAPGDYHRFHSPVPWVVERRRHFAGELYSVSPWLQSRLPGLFTLNERVVLLGRWRHGLYGMTLVGATNVGSIKIHFDAELRTNSFTKAATPADRGGGFAEATYERASALLRGYPLTKGAEIGGFNLGSTIVLVFEAPATDGRGGGRGGFRFCVERGQYVKVGEAVGVVEE